MLNSGESEDYKVMKVFWKYFPECFEYDELPENKKDNEKLLEALSALEVEQLPAEK